MSLLVFFVAAASANDISSLLPSNPGSGSSYGGYRPTYYHDDGSSENSIGLTAGGELAWMEKFTVSGGNNVITGIKCCFGCPLYPGMSGATAGKAFSYYVWSGVPNGTYSLLYEGAGTVAAGSIDTDVFQTVSVPNTVIPGADFFVGISFDQAAGQYPGPLDQHGSTAGYAWVAGSSTQGGFNPNNIAGGIGLYDMSTLFPGYWLLRADAIPEPASLLLLGALALLRRR
jgi:hypothetical protein